MAKVVKHVGSDDFIRAAYFLQKACILFSLNFCSFHTLYPSVEFELGSLVYLGIEYTDHKKSSTASYVDTLFNLS